MIKYEPFDHLLKYLRAEDAIKIKNRFLVAKFDKKNAYWGTSLVKKGIIGSAHQGIELSKCILKKCNMVKKNTHCGMR